MSIHYQMDLNLMHCTDAMTSKRRTSEIVWHKPVFLNHKLCSNTTWKYYKSHTKHLQFLFASEKNNKNSSTKNNSMIDSRRNHLPRDCLLTVNRLVSHQTFRFYTDLFLSSGRFLTAKADRSLQAHKFLHPKEKGIEYIARIR